jgi:hypothetical protein
MGKAKTLVMLALGAAIGIGVTKAIPKVYDWATFPNIEFMNENTYELYVTAIGSDSVTGHFIVGGGNVNIKSSEKTSGGHFVVKIPVSNLDSHGFKVSIEDSLGHKTVPRRYVKQERWANYEVNN